jgi:hypothetical protein
VAGPGWPRWGRSFDPRLLRREAGRSGVAGPWMMGRMGRRVMCSCGGVPDGRGCPGGVRVGGVEGDEVRFAGAVYQGPAVVGFEPLALSPRAESNR